MILDKEIEVTLHGNNIKHFKNLGYKNLKSGNKILIPIEHLSLGSHSIINVKCDVCGTKKQMTYQTYLKNIKIDCFYTCSKCSIIKNKKTCLKKYGDENYRNIGKNKETCLKKYGDENYNNIEKNKKTCIEKYGVKNVFQNKEIKEKSNMMILEKIWCN